MKNKNDSNTKYTKYNKEYNTWHCHSPKSKNKNESNTIILRGTLDTVTDQKSQNIIILILSNTKYTKYNKEYNTWQCHRPKSKK